MEQKPWAMAYPKNVKPSFAELLAYWPEDVRALFLQFNEAMNRDFEVYNKWQRYGAAGWTYGYCRNYRCELLSVTVGEGCFRVLGAVVTDEASFQNALCLAKQAYDAGYEAKYTAVSAAKRGAQSERAAVRTAREKAELSALQQSVERLNRFRWPPKVSRSKLVALYKGEAAGRLDEELLEEVGYAFFYRCKMGLETIAGMETGKMLCHHCNAVLQAVSYTAPIACTCGESYTLREYRRSHHTANMPAGRAEPVFRAFEQKWPACRDADAKMLAIDWLVHECHVTVMSGDVGRSVCVNLIEGTKAQLRDMLEMLAGHK